MERPHRIILHNPYDKESLIATMYSRVVEILIKSSNGWDSEKVNIIDAFKKIVEILLASEPGLESEELKELEILRNRILHLLDTHIQEELGKLDTARDILEPILIPSSLEEHSLESSDIDDLLKQDKRSLAEQVLALKKRVAQLENNSDVIYEDETCAANDSSNGQISYVLRNRDNRIKISGISNLDIREDIPGEDQYRPPILDKVKQAEANSNEHSSELPFVRSSNSYLEDLVLILTAMYDLGFFVEFNPRIKATKVDLKTKQKAASKKDVFRAIGSALNLKGFDTIYDSYFQNTKKNRVEGIDTSVFEKMKEMIELEEKRSKIPRKRK